MQTQSHARSMTYYANLPSDTRTRKAKVFVLNMKKQQQSVFSSLNKLQELAIRAGFLVAYNIGNHSKPLF
jgi:poly(3-hydroxybutyrate) depolymerase